MDKSLKETLIGWAQKYNDPKYFTEDPIIFPRFFTEKYDKGLAVIADIEISALLSAHLAWGRRSMIVRDCNRMFEEMGWQPYEYVMNGEYRNEDVSLHRTIKWSEFAGICSRLRSLYMERSSIEGIGDMEIRTRVFGQKEDRKAPNKKISMMRRWLVRDDGKVDLGIWKNTSKESLIIPLDVHVYAQASALGLTQRRQKDIVTAREITDAFKEIWPDDPCMGDFALFGYGVTHKKSDRTE
ncbi:MAG: TIGR02757 family protein [Bacteroidales bacterium]|nr:TIGR02757 family protein [Bacteroidales bacterium]